MNHCLYTNMYEYKFVLGLDVDEVLFPVQDNTWQQLLKRANMTDDTPSLSVRNVYFFKDWSKYNHSYNTSQGILDTM